VVQDGDVRVDGVDGRGREGKRMKKK